MNIIKHLEQRIESYRKENKNPCRNYSTEEKAEKFYSEVAMKAAKYFHKDGNNAQNVQSAHYVVFFNKAWGRWVGGIDMTELLNRPDSTGGYLGICGPDVYTY